MDGHISILAGSVSELHKELSNPPLERWIATDFMDIIQIYPNPSEHAGRQSEKKKKQAQKFFKVTDIPEKYITEASHWLSNWEVFCYGLKEGCK